MKKKFNPVFILTLVIMFVFLPNLATAKEQLTPIQIHQGVTLTQDGFNKLSGAIKTVSELKNSEKNKDKQQLFFKALDDLHNAKNNYANMHDTCASAAHTQAKYQELQSKHNQQVIAVAAIGVPAAFALAFAGYKYAQMKHAQQMDEMMDVD